MTMSAMPSAQWLRTGQTIFPAMLEAINAAGKSIRLETYIYTDGRIGRQFLEALTRAAQRGVQVSVLVDAFGSWPLPETFFASLRAAGARVKYFNPLRFSRFGVRDHRKLLVCDQTTAFVGGFNLADEYDGDGVTRGWCDVGMRIDNTVLASELAISFDELYALADFRRRPLRRLRLFKRKRPADLERVGELLCSQPGRGAGPFQTALQEDLTRARDIQIITAYFLPTRRLRRLLMRAKRRGSRVQLILAGRSDVLISQLAARSLYRRLLKAGVEIYEYQPQILHAKLIICDGVIYTGSSNLDIRSLKLNYELMLRFEEKSLVTGAREFFAETFKLSHRIELRSWVKSLSWWHRWQHRWSRFLVARIDPLIALRQFRSLGK